MKKLILTILCLSLTFGETNKPIHQNRNADSEHVLWDGNQISNVHGNHGDISSYHATGQSGLEWPKGSGNKAMFQSGLWVASGQANGQEQIRTAASEYNTEFIPGAVNGSETSGHIFQIHQSEINAFLENDWNTFSSMTLILPVTQIDGNNIYTELVETSLPSDDFMNWPVEDGAPWNDINNDGLYNPADGDYPKIKGDMFHWYIMNDTDASVHQNLWGTTPMDITVRTSMYGFDTFAPLGNTLFIEWDIENTGTDELDSVFIGWWSDVDLGSALDDYIGCDPEDNLAFCYNEYYDSQYGYQPPAFGFQLLQGPIAPSDGDTAWVYGNSITNYLNLNMSALAVFSGGWQPFDPDHAQEAMNYMNGLKPDFDPFIDPTTNEPTPFMYNGDPVSGNGWVEMNEISGHDVRVLISSGSVSLFPGEVQSVAVAGIISQGVNHLSSISSLRNDAELIRHLWDEQFETIDQMPLVELVSGPTNNSEDEGPYTFIFDISNDTNLNVNAFEFAYTLEQSQSNFYSLPLNQIGNSLYSVTIPGNNEIHFNYYIDLGLYHGFSMTYPSGAPNNYHSITLGPDITPPNIESISQVRQVHHLLPFRRSVIVENIWDNRFEIQTPLLHWELPNESTYSIEMEMISNEFDPLDWVTKYTFEGVITGFIGQEDGPVHYWVTVSDSSINENEATSEVHSFSGSDFEVLGNWENEIREDWDFMFGQISEFNYPNLVNFDNALVEHANESDTTFYLRPLDLTHFNDVWLSIPMLTSLRNNEAFVEVTDSSGNWIELDYIQSEGFDIYVPNHYDLSPFTDQDSLYLRFRLNIISSFAEWVFDDILLHTIPEWLNAENEMIPVQFGLQPPFPNPFNPNTTIRFSVETQRATSLHIFDITGRVVATLVDGMVEPGNHEIQWNASNHPSGIYFAKMISGNFSKTQKLILLK